MHVKMITINGRILLYKVTVPRLISTRQARVIFIGMGINCDFCDTKSEGGPHLNFIMRLINFVKTTLMIGWVFNTSI